MSLRHPLRPRFIKFGMLLSLLLLLPSTALAAPADVIRDRTVVDDTFVGTNFCGWLSTFHEFGQSQLHVTVVADNRVHVVIQEAINWTLVITDDPSVPAAVQGLEWRGRNEFVLMDNFDLSSAHEVFHTVQVSSEGPFKALKERLFIVIAADGTVHVDRFISEFDGDCDALLA